MDIADYAATSRVPLKTLRWMAAQEIVSNPLTDRNLIGLEMVEKVWKKRDFLRPQVRQMDVKARQTLINTCTLATKWERYAYSRFMNLGTGKKLFMKHLVAEIELTYRFKLSENQVGKLFQLRKRVHKAKERAQAIQEKITETSNFDPEIHATKTNQMPDATKPSY
jgi:hypothetical protein